MKYSTIAGDLADVHPSRSPRSGCARRLVSLDNPGFCLDCGADADGVEPDARQYRCESCGLLAVFGADEVLLMVA
jgi:hypothetical protein